jgi:hypothetical protein
MNDNKCDINFILECSPSESLEEETKKTFQNHQMTVLVFSISFIQIILFLKKKCYKNWGAHLISGNVVLG